MSSLSYLGVYTADFGAEQYKPHATQDVPAARII